MDKETLEIEKLQEEIKEIRCRIKASPTLQRLEKWKVYPTYFAIAVSLVLGMLGYFHQRQEYLDQRKQQIKQEAEEQKFKVNQAMILLVQQLNDKKSSALQRNAALELSFFGRPAIPILIENLDIQHQRVVHQAIAKSLKEIMMSEKNAAVVILPLLLSIKNILQRELTESQPSVWIMLANINALNTLITGLQFEAYMDDSETLRETIKKYVKYFQKILGNNKNENISPDDQSKLDGALKILNTRL
jgi:hypothetical protein